MGDVLVTDLFFAFCFSNFSLLFLIFAFRPQLLRVFTMTGIITWTCLGAVLFATLRLYRDLRINIAKAKQTGLPYVLGRKFCLVAAR